MVMTICYLYHIRVFPHEKSPRYFLSFSIFLIILFLIYYFEYNSVRLRILIKINNYNNFGIYYLAFVEHKNCRKIKITLFIKNRTIII